MEITYVPVLAILRDLYAQPRDMARFQRYLSTITQGTQDVVVPIVAANPMAREHVLLRVNELLAQGAEEVGAATAEEAATRLAPVPDQLKASLVVADDVGGGWTNRYLSEAGARFDSRVDRKRNFVTTLLWSSEAPTAAEIRQELLGDIYRAAYRRRHGPAQTLRAMLEQEGLAARFAGRCPVLPPEDDRAGPGRDRAVPGRGHLPAAVQRPLRGRGRRLRRLRRPWASRRGPGLRWPSRTPSAPGATRWAPSPRRPGRR